MSDYERVKSRIEKKLAPTKNGFEIHMNGMDFHKIPDVNTYLETLKSEHFIDFGYYMNGIDYGSIKLL